MMKSVFAKTLHDRFRGAVGWALAAVGTAGVYLAFWPTIRDQPDLEALLDAFPEAMRAIFGIEEITTPAGYLNTEMFTFLIPIFFLVLGIGFGSSATTKEVEDGSIDILMANPISRTRVLLNKFAAFCVSSLIPAAGLFIALWGGGALVDLRVPLGNLAAAVVGVYLLGVVFAGLSLATSTATGRRGPALGVGVFLAVTSFLLSSLGPLVEGLEPWRILSPMYHSSGYSPLRHGFGWDHLAVLIVAAAVLVASSVFAFERRDLT